MSSKQAGMLSVLMLLSLVLSACTMPTPERIVETVLVDQTRVVEVTPTFEAAPAEPKTLVVCMRQEPQSLYIHDNDAAALHIHQAIYDGPNNGLDNRTYSYQPVILTKLPRLDDGDAVINTVTVQTGDLVVNNNGNPVELVQGVLIRPAGCRSFDCAVAFQGTPVEMERMVVSFQMVEGLTWSNGDPVTADDSVYNYELSADPNTPANKYLVMRTAAYEAPTATTAVWTGLPGFVDPAYFSNFFQPLPRRLWQDELNYSASDLMEAEESVRQPMGWGPFTITEWINGEHIAVERNPHYFRADEGLPYLDAVVFRFVSDPYATVAKLISGECHIITHEEDGWLHNEVDLLLRLEQEGIVQPVFSTDAVWEQASFGIDPASGYDRPGFFGDVRVRQAIAHCLNRQSIVDDLLYGRSVVLDTYVPPDHPYYAAGRVSSWDYNPEAGRALLEEVGWVDETGGVRMASGIEDIPDGTPLAFDWMSTTLPMRVQYMERFQQDLADCGIAVNLQNLSAAELYADGPNGPLFGRRFDISSFAWLTGFEPSCDLYLGLEDNIPSAANNWDGSNAPGFRDDAYDAECLRALSALPDSEAYREGHREAQRRFSEQLPAVPLFLHIKIAVTRPEVEGFVMDPTEVSELWNIELLDLAP